MSISPTGPSFQGSQPNSPQKADRQQFAQDAKADGIDIKSIIQQAIAGLPSGTSSADRHAAIQAAIQQAVQGANDPKLQQDFAKIQQDKANKQQQGGPNNPTGTPGPTNGFNAIA